MLLAADLYDFVPLAGRLVVGVAMIFGLILAGWIIATWFEGRLELTAVHGGYPRPSLLRGHHLAELGYLPGPGRGTLIAAAAAVEAQDEGEFDDEGGAVRWVVEHGLAPIGMPAPPSAAQRGDIARWRRDRRPALEVSESDSPATS